MRIGLYGIKTKSLNSYCSIMALIVFFDHQKVERDFRNTKAFLNNARLETLEKGRALIVKFNEKEIRVSDYTTGKAVRSMKCPTLHEVNYDTKIGKDMIVFENGVTNAFNIRIHGGDLSLKSLFGFTKSIHINCAGYIREGNILDVFFYICSMASNNQANLQLSFIS